ncbi:hypothetical protein GCM10020219_018030 [Nonomuraea dietziae]
MIVPKNGLSEDDVLVAVLEAGAEEVNDLGESFEVVSEAGDLVPVRKARAGGARASTRYGCAESSFRARPMTSRSTRTARCAKVFRLIRDAALEDSDDVCRTSFALNFTTSCTTRSWSTLAA